MHNPFSETRNGEMEDAELVTRPHTATERRWSSWSCGIRHGSTTSPSAWSFSRTTPKR